MRTNLKYVKTEKFRNGQTTVVKEYATVDLSEIPSLSLLMHLPMVDEYLKTFGCNYDNGVLHITGTGVAKLDSNDVFNEKTGFYIAQSRASLKVIRQYRRFMDNVLRLIETTFVNQFEDIRTRLIDAEFALKDHINLDLITE